MTLDEFRRQWLSPEPYIVAHTSGSTGTPKEIRLLKADMRLSARATNSRFGIKPDSVLAIPLSMDYIAGKMMAVRAFEAGCRLIELPVSNRIELNEPVDLLAIVPSQVDSIVSDANAHRIRNVIIGGARLDNTRRSMLAGMPFAAFCTYGMTETCSHVALADALDTQGIYSAMPGISFSIDSRDCLRITAGSMSFGTLQTNDVVELLDNGRFRWLGRADNAINSGGIKIMAEELECCLQAVLKVPFYIKAEPDDKWGEVPVLVAEAPHNMLPLIQQAIDSLGLGRRKPQRIYCVPALPRTANGKIRRV
jgi:O-succinylbenzoic acid--CoA ligase